MKDDQLDLDMSPPEIPPEELPPDVPKARNVLMDFLERSRAEIEDEGARLMEKLKAKEEEERQRREEEEAAKAAELRAIVEEERRAREEAERAYEQRKERKAREAEQKAAAARVVTTVAAPEPKKSKVGIFVTLGIVLVAGAAVAVFFLMPKPVPVTMTLDRPFDTARPGTVLATPLPYGPKAIADAGKPWDPELLVARFQVAKYEAPEPAPVVRKTTRSSSPKPLVNIKSGILGGKRVIR
ncbi:MAG TPA: hypothetical protein PLC97_00355 [Myxococcota bacterium]|nr:hypothetical protein [Myxococcota bacterium]